MDKISIRPRLHGTTVDPYGHDINNYLKSLKTSVSLKFVIILQNLIKTNHRKSGKSKYDRKLTKLDVVTTRIRYRVNGISVHYRPLDWRLRQTANLKHVHSDKIEIMNREVLKLYDLFNKSKILIYDVCMTTERYH